MSKTCKLRIRAIRGVATGFSVTLQAGLIAGAIARPALAQTPAPLSEWQYSAGVPLEKLFEPPSNWRVSLGAAIAMQPRYNGSDRYHLLIGPSIDIRYRDLFFASTGEGVGVNLLQGPNWRAGVAIAYDLGRRESDDREHLRGLGNINPAAEPKLFGEYVVSKNFPLVVRADFRRSIGGSNGWIGDLGAYLPLPGSTKKFFWFAGPDLTFADSRYMNSWFGISQAQAARSGYAPYHAGAGLKSVGAGITAIWFLQKHWFVTADAALAQLVGSAAHSPLTQTLLNTAVDLSINYQF